MFKELSKAYEPEQYEDDIYERWEQSGFFNPDICVKKGICEQDADPFSIVLPPPNTTGQLHIGHSVMLAIEDIMIRYHRMKGDRTLWIPGTDHAAIATNAVVERQLSKEGKTKYDLGREKYIEKVKKYISDSQDTMRGQIRKMGASLDWSREAYTWDDQRGLAVNTMFKKMYDDELIYRGNRIVNWCPHCHSTLADDEVEHKQENGKFYWIKYGPFVLATARPETKLGDTAVAVHPDDERYKDMVGKKYMIPGVLGEFEIVVVADEAVDPEFGSGAVKVTPSHSFTDNEIAQRHGIGGKQVINEDGCMMENCGKYAGMNTKEAREAITADMQEMGLIDHIEEDYKHNLSICYRCKHVIEPIPSKQWFVDVNKEFDFLQSKEHPIQGLDNGQKISLKKLMQYVVHSQQIEIIPDRFCKTYFHWIDNLRDWCISRQIWVGHRIPVWYKGGETYVGVEPPVGEEWIQDPDTLDTWFSSGMWTFSTLGWPATANDLKIYHPTNVLETMFDILFFWVARMIMMSAYALGEVPFKTVYLHARVLDRDGEKMSKSKPETMIDPLDVCQKYGTDAVRLSLLLGVSPGSDVSLSVEKIQGFRNFANKLWNISRFMLMNIDQSEIGADVPKAKTLSDQWILSRLNQVVLKCTENIEKYEFSQAGEMLKEFTWNDLADWYLEIAKVEGDKSKILNHALNTILKLWHPFMPFVTETIWSEVYGKEKMLMVQKWPATVIASEAKQPNPVIASEAKQPNPVIASEAKQPNPVIASEAKQSRDDFELIKNIVTQIRHVRAENGIEPGKKTNVLISAGDSKKVLEENSEIIKRLWTGIDKLEVKTKADNPGGWFPIALGDVEIFVDLSGAVDIDKIKKELAETEKYVKILEKKLTNQEFVKNAPKQVVSKEQEKLDQAKEKSTKLTTQLENLK
ncbi:MAG: valine--tRNA ligase [bacterium]